MNRFTNKQYLIDITLKSLEAPQPSLPSKIKCEVHFGDDNYLRLNIQPLLRNGVALFCDERLRIPFSPEVDLVFKIIKPNKKQLFLGHYSIEIEKMLADKNYAFKLKDKLEESDAWVDFQCRIIDKQLLCESQTDQLDAQAPRDDKSVVTWGQKNQKKLKLIKCFSELNLPYVIVKKATLESIPLNPEEFGKLLREVEDIMKKKQIFAKKEQIIKKYSRDKYGNLQTEKIQDLQARLSNCKRERLTNRVLIYLIVAAISFLIGLNLR